jgi:hypothetical protein
MVHLVFQSGSSLMADTAPLKKRVKQWLPKNEVYFEYAPGLTGRVLRFVKLVGLPYPAALVYYLILVQQGKRVEHSLNPLFAILIVSVILSVVCLGVFLSVYAHRFVNEEDSSDGGVTRQVKIVQESFFARCSSFFELMSSSFIFSLIFVYCLEKASGMGLVGRPSDYFREYVAIPGIYAFTINFVLISAVVTLIVCVFRAKRTAAVILRKGHPSATVLKEEFRSGVLVWGYLWLTSCLIFHYFFVRHAWVLDLDEKLRTSAMWP